MYLLTINRLEKTLNLRLEIQNLEYEMNKKFQTIKRKRTL
jgi:hypothetical protein